MNINRGFEQLGLHTNILSFLGKWMIITIELGSIKPKICTSKSWRTYKLVKAERLAKLSGIEPSKEYPERFLHIFRHIYLLKIAKTYANTTTKMKCEYIHFSSNLIPTL
jgi:hypothetical protein